MTNPEISAPARRVTRAAATAALALASTCALGAGWQLLPSPSLSIDLNTVGPSTQYPGATGVWLDYAPGLSVDCSPPAGCYAYKQRIYYVFTCAPRWAAPFDRISMNLNGKVVNQQTRDPSEPYAPEYDGGGVSAQHVLPDARPAALNACNLGFWPGQVRRH